MRPSARADRRSEEHTSELQSRSDLVCRLLLEKKKPRRAFHHDRVIQGSTARRRRALGAPHAGRGRVRSRRGSPRAGTRVHAPVFFFNDTATTEIYTLSLHDALPICVSAAAGEAREKVVVASSASTQASTRSEEHTSELQSRSDLVCRLLLEKKN